MGIGLISGFGAYTLTYPFEFLKTKIFLHNEGIGIRQKGIHMGYSYVKVGMNLIKNGYGVSTFYTGYVAAIKARMQFLLVRNSVYRILYDRFKPQKYSTHQEQYTKH